MEKYILTMLSVVVFYAIIGMVYEHSATTGLIIVNGPGNKLAQKGIIVHKPTESKGIIVHKPIPTLQEGPFSHPIEQKSKQEKRRMSVGGGFKKSSSQSNLQKIIKETEAQQETLKNKRQTTLSNFQGSDQRAQQQYNQISSILKTTNEATTLASRGST